MGDLLRGIDDRLTPELLLALASMGHGDRIAIVDRNFPAVSSGRPVERLPVRRSASALEAVLSLMPLETDLSGASAFLMQASQGDAAVHEELIEILEQHGLAGADITAIDRFPFYELCREVFVIVQTGENRPFGNVVMSKGVL